MSRSRVSNICSNDHHRNFEEIWSGLGCQEMVDTSKLGVGLETEVVSKNLEESINNDVIVEEHYITCMFTFKGSTTITISNFVRAMSNSSMMS